MSSGDEGTVGQVPRAWHRDDHHQDGQVSDSCGGDKWGKGVGVK